MRSNLERLIKPKTIAVFGGKEARRVIEQCRKVGYDGPIWPVHPRLDQILGLKCYRSIDELPEAPDASFVGVNRQVSIGIVRQLAAIGGGGAVCYASGFREAVHEFADGEEMQIALVEAAGDLALVGPNCYGFINMLDGALLWPDQHGMQRVEKGVAILSQSSNIAINLSMQARGLPIAYLLTLGNQAQQGFADLGMAALEDPRVTAIGLHIEGFGDVKGLERLAARARELKKPIVALKVGRSEAAQRAAISHTASLAGDDDVASAIMARFGIGRVETIPEFLEALKLLHVHGPLETGALSSMSCSGGEASLISDAGLKRQIEFPPLQAEQIERLRTSLGPMVALANPLDYHTFIWGNLDHQIAAFSAMMAGGYSLNLIVLDFPRTDRCDPADWMITANAVIAASKATGAKAAIVASLPENLPEDLAYSLIEKGVAPLSGIDDALAAAEVAAQIGAAWRRPPAPPLLAEPLANGESVVLYEDTAKRLLSEFGLPVPKSATVEAPSQAASAAHDLGFPVALKGLGVAHKTEAGAVKLNLGDTAAVLEAARAMSDVASGFLVEQMVPKPVCELIIGATRDPASGLVLTIGAGGILVEVLKDSAILTLPVTEDAISEAIDSLKVSRLLHGYRGTAAGDITAIHNAIQAVAAFLEAHASTIEELDINPLMVLPEGQGVVAADALIRMRKPEK